MKLVKKILEAYFKDFSFFYSYVGKGIFVSVVLSLIVGVMDGFGLAMFLPLLQMVDNPMEVADSEQMGNLSFIVEGMTGLGFSLNIQSILLVMLLFFIMKGIVRFGEGYCRVVLQQKFIKQLRVSYIDLLAGYKYKSFISIDPGIIQNTLSAEVERVVIAYRTYFQALQYIVLVAVYVTLAIMANPQFAILVAVGGLLVNLLIKKVYKYTKSLSKLITKESHVFQGLIIQNVAHFKYLKATGLMDFYGDKLKRSVNVIESYQRKVGILSSLLGAIREPVTVFIVVVVVLVQVNIFSQNLGLIILSLLFIYRSLTYLMNIQNYWNTFLTVSGSLDNVTTFTNELKGKQEITGLETFDRFSSSLSLVDACVTFKGDKKVLKNITLNIAKNETIAIVGESGSGKTTLMNVLCGLLPISEGNFKVDGIDSSAINIKDYRKRVGYITQEPVIFNDTLFNNVTFWDTPSQQNMIRFRKAIELASLDSLVNSLPEKENAYLGSNGVMVSGGQKQRISIAREIYKDVDLLFMDEATSALDTETENDIQKNIDNLKGKYTIIIIAHRISTIRNADRIVLMSNGEIKSINNFEELKRHSETFSRMVALQEF